MISLEDCVAMCGLSAEEVSAIAEHEHLPETAAAALANYLLHKSGGPAEIRQMIVDDIRDALAGGQTRHASDLLGALRHFLDGNPTETPQAHSEATVKEASSRADDSTKPYYFSKKVPGPFHKAIDRATEVLKQQGFGIITDINVSETFRSKLGINFRNYRILGACNPVLAYNALMLEDKVGTMLPCNVVVQETGEGTVEVAAIDPVASMQAINNSRLKGAAMEVREKLRQAIADL